MKSKKKRSNDAVADIVGNVLMLGMAVSLIAMVYISVLSYPFTPSPISADLIGYVDGNSIIIEHHGGDSLSLSTEIAVTVGGSTTRITVEDYLDDESKADGLWNIGERVVYSDETLTDLEVKAVVVDADSNSAILMGVLQEGDIISLATSVDTISPYIQASSPFTVNATGDSGLDNVTLYYRWSDDNVSWSGGDISGETNDTVDSNTTDVDSSSDKGIETNFANAQDVSPDSDFMNIQEENTGGASGSEWLNCNAYGNNFPASVWTKVGSSPYLDSQDQPTNYIYTKSSDNQDGWFDFPSTTFSGTITVNISIYCKNDDGAGNDWADVYVDYTGSGSGSDAGDVAQHTNWQYDTISLDTHTVSEVNNLRVSFIYRKVSGADEVYIDHIRIGVSGTSNDNFELDFEYQWSNADFDKANEEICFYVDSHNGSENLNVNYWSGSSWSSLGSITGTGWTNLTATGLTSSTYTIQLIGALESGDSSQDDWDIDVISLHTWNSTQGVNWGIWSNASNPDVSSPWSWNFDFPNGNGYYEFYSIGKYGGSSETAPSDADAICKYEG